MLFKLTKKQIQTINQTNNQKQPSKQQQLHHGILFIKHIKQQNQQTNKKK